MRDNPMKRKLEAGGVSLGTMVTEFATPAILRIAAARITIVRTPRPGHSLCSKRRSR